jgi:RNA polymerase sigma-70 factor (ECF subfamily)
MRTQTQTLPNFESLVDAYYRPLFKFAVSLSGNLESALNLTQHTFLKALHRPEVLAENRKIRPWLFTILFSEFLTGQGVRPAQREACPPQLTETPLSRHVALEPSAV